MNLAILAAKNIGRHRLRTTLTALGIALAIVLFLVMRTLVDLWTGAIDHAAQDRLVARNKITFIMPLPKRYATDVAAIPGVTQVTYANWFGGKLESKPTEFFATIAVDPQTFLPVVDEILVPPEQAEAWKKNRRGALVGDQLATKFGWKVGDKVVLQGSIFPGDWEFIIEGIYTANRRTVDRNTLWFHWDYLNDSLTDSRKDQIGWITIRINDPARAAEIARQIDTVFAERDTQTLTMNEKAFQQSFLGMFSAILTAVDVVSVAILIIILLMLGNTMSMTVRERTSEFGSLRALGFLPRHIASYVIGEALTIALLGGAVGVLLAVLFINFMLGPGLEEMMTGWFPYFRVPLHIAGLALVISAVLGVLAAAIPAYQASRLNVVDALRALE